MIFLLELLAALLIAGGIFLMSVPFGMISVGLFMLLFAFAFERSRGKAKWCCHACWVVERNERSRTNRCSLWATASP